MTDKKRVSRKRSVKSESIPLSGEELIPLLERSGLLARSRYFRGPLPPQVLDKIDKESADKMVTHFIQHVGNQDKLNEKLLDHLNSNTRNERKHNTIKLIFYGTIFLAVFIICIYTKNTDFLNKLISFLALLVGGTGFGLYLRDKKIKQNKEPQIEIDDQPI